VILGASDISHFQQCRRRHALERRFRVRRWRPRLLYEHWLRQGIFSLSNGQEPSATFARCRAGFLAACASPGLDTPSASFAYTQARDWTAAIDTTLRAAARLSLLSLHHLPPAPLQLAPTIRWRFSSPVDDSGTLHRWIAVSSWSEDELSRAAHSWWCFGDMCVARANCMLHVVEVGSLRRYNGSMRRDSCWTRAYRHPTMPMLKLMFRRRDGSEAFGGRVPAYLADLPAQSPDDWVEQLFACGMVKDRMRHITLACPGDAVCLDTVGQIVDETNRMRRDDTTMEDYYRLPMSHSACDGNPPCPWQAACYAPRMTEPEVLDLGLYDPRNIIEPATVTVSIPPPAAPAPTPPSPARPTAPPAGVSPVAPVVQR
jgi:hypothetical protein